MNITSQSSMDELVLPESFLQDRMMKWFRRRGVPIRRAEPGEIGTCAAVYSHESDAGGGESEEVVVSDKALASGEAEECALLGILHHEIGHFKCQRSKCYCSRSVYMQHRPNWQLTAAEVHADQFALHHALVDGNAALVQHHMENTMSYLAPDYSWPYSDDMHIYRSAARHLFRTDEWERALELVPQFEKLEKVHTCWDVTPKMRRTYYFNRGHRRFDTDGFPTDERKWWLRESIYALDEEELNRLPRFRVRDYW